MPQRAYPSFLAVLLPILLFSILMIACPHGHRTEAAGPCGHHGMMAAGPDGFNGQPDGGESAADAHGQHGVLAAGSGIFALALAAWTAIRLAGGRPRRGAAGNGQADDRRLRMIANDFPGVILRRVLHPDGRLSIPYLSEGGRALLDLDHEDGRIGPETVERVAERLIAPEDRDAWIATLRRSARTLEPTAFEVRVLNRAGGRTWVRTIARPSLEPDGSVAWDTVTVDIGDLKLAREELRLRLAERDLLLREVHHRVKNNLQAVWGLIQVERSRLGDATARDRLDAIGRRISALGAIHEQFYAAENLQRIDCLGQLSKLALRSAERQERSGIRIEVAGEPIRCDLDTALTIGMIADELIDNCCRHAFPDGRPGTVRVSLDRIAGGIRLTVEDDGVGMGRERPDGIGGSIVEALAGQIGASVATATGPAGTVVRISIPGRDP